MNPMDIQQFAIPVAAFDVNLLPPGARTVGSAEFQDAVVRERWEEHSLTNPFNKDDFAGEEEF